MNHSDLRLTVPLSATAHHLALQFAAEQANPPKGKQVYLNTLAVWAVQHYLSWLQIETDWAQSQSWQAEFRALWNATDLVLPRFGKIHCCPVLPDEAEIVLMPEQHDAIGYIAVQVDSALQQVELLGFFPAIDLAETVEALPLSAFQPLDALFDRLYALEHAVEPKTHFAPASSLVHLGQWMQQQFEAGWIAVESLFSERSPSFAFRRSGIRRAKVIELNGSEFGNGEFSDRQSLGLIVTLIPDPIQINIHLQLCPLGEQTRLPAQLKLQILTETGDLFREVMSGDADTFIQYEFTGQPGERFGVEVVWQSQGTQMLFVI
jgi:hypothetical protein